MAGKTNIPLSQAKDVVRNVIGFIKIEDIDTDNLSDSVEADILKEYINNSDFENALRLVCIDNDITYSPFAPEYIVNNIVCILRSDAEVKLFWSAISSDELLKQSIIQFKNA